MSKTKALSLDKRGRLKVTEAQLQKDCIDLLRAEHWTWFETHSRRAYASAGDKGQPDLAAVKVWDIVDTTTVTRTLLLELKTASGKLSEAQLDWHTRAEQRGLKVDVIRSVDDLRAVLG